jgi:predicted TIM-barrel fold metal-dependent hydrolase
MGEAPNYSAVIDGCAFHEWQSSMDLLRYMDAGWASVLVPVGSQAVLGLRGSRLIFDPHRGPTAIMEPQSGIEVPGSDYEAFERDVLGQATTERVVLGYDIGLQGTSFAQRYLARDIAQAANDWTVAEWLPRDERLHAMMLVATSIPEAAAAEIRRIGRNDRIVAVALGCNGLARPFGEPAYHPIYEAAAELGLPLVIQVGSEISGDQPLPAVAGGNPSTYAEFRVHAGHANWNHVASLITEGVFTRFPKLKVLLVGGGAAALPSQLWALDYWYKMSGPAFPWIERLPSEYFVDHVRVSTVSLENPRQPERLAQALGVLAGIERVLLYTSGYPDDEWETAEKIAERLPAEWHERVFRTNAEEFFRWPELAGGNEAVVTSDVAGGL